MIWPCTSNKEPACQCRRHETWVWSLGQEDPLKKEMATHSSIPAWRSTWTGELGCPGVARIGHHLATKHNNNDLVRHFGLCVGSPIQTLAEHLLYVRQCMKCWTYLVDIRRQERLSWCKKSPSCYKHIDMLDKYSRWKFQKYKREFRKIPWMPERRRKV